MAEGELKLLGLWYSPFVLRVRMMLEQKGLSYEYLEQDLSNKSELLLKHNPIYKKVPVLIHGNRVICESLAILEYIDENWSGTGPRVLPADPYKRAVSRFWAVYIDDKLLSSAIGILMAATEEVKAEKIKDTHTAFEMLEEAFKKCFSGKSFFGGETIGYLDVTLGSYLISIRAAERISESKLLDETMVPLLVEWENRFLAAECAKKTLPSVERVEEHARMLRRTRWEANSSN
ncbi:hypothetical protein LUZ61_019574 [Rhynchospora tenuis]|uniref:Glutathione S-transferase n=1 Tax=Rhynchospora tenuis TaxID=198213 RepID=A0AAD5ZBM6_9POAL|nr:hypothetical protein LUZ61_019574 [Rhynchospora tenuis]